MCDHKLSSEEVPEKFSEWLLSMGCPPEKVPTVDKVVEMCRGQYYMVWRSLMEHVEAKDVIRQKRLTVFCDDVYKWKRKNAFNKQDTGTVMPAELQLWHQHNNIKEKVENTEERVVRARQTLNQLMENITSKLSERNQSRRSVQNAQRRAWLLQQVAAELSTKKENLEETRAIANSLCSTEEEVDVQSKLERYMMSGRRGSAQAASVSMLGANPVASSSVVSNGDVQDNEDPLSWLRGCRGSALWPLLAERRSGLVSDLAKDSPQNKHNPGASPQAVVSHTAALHCALSLEALAGRARVDAERGRLAAAVAELSTVVPGSGCELLVVRSERARAEARAAALRTLLRDVTSRAGAFAAGGEAPALTSATRRQISAVDKAIECKKDDLKRLVASLAATEKKIYSARESLINMFNGFHKDVSFNDTDRFKSQVESPVESAVSLRRYYESRRERALQLSMELDSSELASFTHGDNNPKFADEIRIYLKKFNLEKNRKLVLESGEKVWSFESLSALSERLPAPLAGPQSLRALSAAVQHRDFLQRALETVRVAADKGRVDIDITQKSKEEEAIADKIKKRLNDNILSLNKTNKTLDLGLENLHFWSENEMRKHISPKRMVEGKCYEEYEEIYVMNLN